MSKPDGGDAKSTLYCSFCGRAEHAVCKLIAGPAFICDECVELCMDLIREAQAPLCAFHKTVGLATQGIASVFHLRRVFGRLLDKVFAENKGAQGWLDEEFRKLRMPERIDQHKAGKQELDAELARSIAEMSRLIDKAFAGNKGARGWLDEEFRKLRMPERIEQLKTWKQELDAELDRSVTEMWRAGAEIVD
jgi:hypothetical protein